MSKRNFDGGWAPVNHVGARSPGGSSPLFAVVRTDDDTVQLLERTERAFSNLVDSHVRSARSELVDDAAIADEEQTLEAPACFVGFLEEARQVENRIAVPFGFGPIQHHFPGLAVLA